MEEISDVKWMTEKEIKDMDRYGETIDSILELANDNVISLDRIKIENFLK